MFSESGAWLRKVGRMFAGNACGGGDFVRPKTMLMTRAEFGGLAGQ